MKRFKNICVGLLGVGLTGACVTLGVQALGHFAWGAWTLDPYPEALRPVSALIALFAGLLLLVPRLTWLGCLTMAGLIVGALGLELARNGGSIYLPSFLLAPLALLAYLRQPAVMDLARLRSATDAFAEREIAAQAVRLHPIKPHMALIKKPSQGQTSIPVTRS
jgi:hypothetical protein